VKNVGGDLNEGVKVVGSDIGQFLNSLGSMAQNTASTVGSDLNSVVNTSGTNIGGVMNYLGNGVNQIVNTSGSDNRRVPSGGNIISNTGKNVGMGVLDFERGIGSMLEKQNNMKTTSYATTPASTGSSLNYNNYSTRSNVNDNSSTTPNATSAYPTTISSSMNNSSKNDEVVNNFTDLYGQNPSAVYKKVKKTVNYEQPVRKGIPSPSGPWFSGSNAPTGNAPGAQGGPKMDPYSYFGSVPAKGWEKDPSPFSSNFSRFT
jgi:hypothetical protein